MTRLSQVQGSFVKDMAKLEEFYLNEIEILKTEKITIIKKHETEINIEVEQIKKELYIEIERITVLVNIYKEKLVKKTTEIRNLLVELHLYKEWKLKYKTLEQEKNAALE